MFKNIILGLTLTLSSISFYANAGLFNSDEVMEVEVAPDFACTDYDKCYIRYIYSVLPLVDGLVVKGVLVNNGRCKLQEKQYFNKRLNTEDYAEFITASDESGKKCRPRTVSIDTNKGSWDFTF